MKSSSEPLSAEEVRAIPAIAARGAAPADATIELGSYAVSATDTRAPEVTARVSPSGGTAGRPDSYHVVIEARGVQVPLGGHEPAVPVRLCSLEEARKQHVESARSSYRPDFLGFRPVPERREEHAAPAELMDQHVRARGPFAFADTTYPWSTFGRVTTGFHSFYFANGVMVGPRHLLTASRIVGWNPDGTAKWLRFAPAYTHGSTPFGTARAELIYSYAQLDYHTLGSRFDLLALDYVVCVLNHRLGDVTGWLNHRAWNPAWTHLPVWGLVTYRADFGSGQERTFQDGFAILSTIVPEGGTPPACGLVLEHAAKMGDPFASPLPVNGAPIFAWWPGEAGPRVVALHSGAFIRPPVHREMAGSGDPLVWLIEQALAEYP